MADEIFEEQIVDQTGEGPKPKKVAQKAANINRFVLDESTLSRVPTVEQSQASKQANNPYVLPDEQLATIKKKDRGTSSLNTDSGSESTLKEEVKPPINFTDLSALPKNVDPVSLLNKEQKKVFSKENGYVLSEQAQKELATNIMGRPINPLDQIISFVQDANLENQNAIRDEAISLSRARKSPEDKVQKEAVEAVLNFRSLTNIDNIKKTITEAYSKGDYSSIKKIINDTLTKQNEALFKTYDVTEEGVRMIPESVKAKFQQQKDQLEQLQRMAFSQKYSTLNPETQQDYKYAIGQSAPSLLTPNQFSGFQYLMETEPEKGKQFETELFKAAMPQQFGLKSYNKNNPEFKYLNYQLDKIGSQLNSYAAIQAIEKLRPEKETLDKDYGQKIAAINQQIINTTDPTERQKLKEAGDKLVAEYNANPLNATLADARIKLQENDNLIASKYPEETKRDREFKVKDILSSDGKSLMGEVGSRLKWLVRDTFRGVGNLTGTNQLFEGTSGSYIKDLRDADEKTSDLYQPQGQSATQALYKLNFTDEDFEALKSIKDSTLSKKEKVDKMTDYIAKNEQRLTYEINPDAGKSNWTIGAIGNQIADVGTQVAYQAALMYATAGAGRLLAAARPAAGAIATTEVVGMEAAASGIGDDVIAGINKGYADLGTKMRNFGNVFGTTFATTYQSAYTNGIQEGLSPDEAENYAAKIAVVNGLTETISPDIDIIKKAAKGVGSVAKGFNSELLTNVGKYKSIAKEFAKGYTQNVLPETLEEVAAAFGEYGVDAIHNINQDDLNSINNRIQQAVTTTMIGMLPLGVFSGANTARKVPMLQKESLYRAGLYPDAIKEEINNLVDQGAISQDQANERIQVVNTSHQIVKNMPSAAEGVYMSEIEKQNYLYNELQRAKLTQKLETAIDGNTKRILNKQIKELTTVNEQLVELATKPQVETEENFQTGKNVPREKFIDEAKRAALNDIAPSMSSVMVEDIEGALKEAAQQLNSSESEAKTARQFYGDRFSDIALQLYPKETVQGAQQEKEITAAGKKVIESVTPILGKINNADEINEKELDDAAQRIYEFLDQVDKTDYTPEQKSSFNNLLEPIIQKLEGYDFRTKTETSIVTEKVPVQVATENKRAARQIVPALEQSKGSRVTVTKENGATSEGILEIEDGNYVVYNENGEKVAAIGEKAINDRDLSLPSEEEMANPVTLDENGNVASVTVKTRSGDLVTINNPEKALDLAIQLSANVIDVDMPTFDTVYQEIQKEIQQEVLVNEPTSTNANQSVPKDEGSAKQQNSQETVPKNTTGTGQDGSEAVPTVPVNQSSNTKANESINEKSGSVQSGQDGRQKNGQDNGKKQSSKSEGQNEVLKEKGADKTAPNSKPKSEDKQKIAFDDKSILARMMKSDKVSEASKEKFKESGLKYKVRDQAEARKEANGIIDEFGMDDALALAEAGKFHGDVNSMIFGSSLDMVYAEEQAATDPAEKQKIAEKWADIALRYQDAAESGGRFISAIQDFYKKSPAGLVIKIEKEFQRREDQWFEGRNKSTKEAFDELIATTEGKELLEAAIDEANAAKKKPKTKVFTEANEKKVKDFFARLKIDTKNPEATFALPVPPQVINGALTLIEKSVLGGMAIGRAIEQGVNYINENYKDTWDADSFRKKIKDGFKAQKVTRALSEEDKAKILKKWSKKLLALNDAQRSALLNKSFVELVNNGALGYDEFKKMYAQAAGLPQMTPELASKLAEISKAINAPNELKESLEKNPTKEGIKSYQQTIENAEKAARQLNELIGKEKSAWDVFTTMMRLNTLGIVSLAGNIAYNITAAPLRFMVNVTATGLDYTLAGVQIMADKLFGKDLYEGRTPYNVFKVQGSYFRGLRIGGERGVEQVISGVSSRDYFQKEVQRNLQPLASAKKLIRAMTGKEVLSLNSALSALLQVTPAGWTAEGIARALNLGDQPFRYAAEFAKAEELAKKKGLTGLNKEVFILFPDEDSAKIIQAHGEKMTFQQKHIVTKALDSAGNSISTYIKDKNPIIKGLYGIAKTLGYTVQPFLNTPLNVFGEFINYMVPEIAIAQAANQMVNKNSDEAIQYLSKAVIGYSMKFALAQLIIQGLFVPGSDDDTKREREGVAAYQRANQINISGLKRMLSGGDPTAQNGDTWIDPKYYGFVGMCLAALGRQYKEMTPEEIQNISYLQDVVGNFQYGVKTGLADGVFSGTNSLLSALNMGGGYLDSWLVGMGNTFTNTFEPQFVRQFSLANDKYLRDTRGMTLPETAVNQLKNRFFMGDKLPTKVNIWGDKVESVPDDRNPYLYYMFGINKKTIYDNRKFGFVLYDYYNKTKDHNVFPPSLMRKLGDTKLDGKQFEQLSILVGSHRRQLVEAYIENGGFENNNGSIISDLKKIYQEGKDIGVTEFYGLYPELQAPEKE